MSNLTKISIAITIFAILVALVSNWVETLAAPDGTLLPDVDNTYDLGSEAQAWRSGYLGTSLVFREATGNITLVANDATTDRTITLADPGGNDSVVYLAASQTLANKTLTAPNITGNVTFGNGSNFTHTFDANDTPNLTAKYYPGVVRYPTPATIQVGNEANGNWIVIDASTTPVILKFIAGGTVRNQMWAGSPNIGDEIVWADPGLSDWTGCRNRIDAAFIFGTCFNKRNLPTGEAVPIAVVGTPLHIADPLTARPGTIIGIYDPGASPSNEYDAEMWPATLPSLRSMLGYDVTADTSYLCFGPSNSGSQATGILDACINRTGVDSIDAALNLTLNGTTRLTLVNVGAVSTTQLSTPSLAFQQASIISTTAGNLTLAPTADLVLKGAAEIDFYTVNTLRAVFQAAALKVYQDWRIERTVAGVAGYLGLNIAISAGGAANAVVQNRLQLDSVTEAALLGETDGAGSYTQLKTVWKIPYADAGAGTIGPTAPTTAATWNGGLFLGASNAVPNGRLYWYANEASHYVDATAGFSFLNKEPTTFGDFNNWKYGDLMVLRVDRYGEEGGHALPYPLEEGLRETLLKLLDVDAEFREQIKSILEIP